MFPGGVLVQMNTIAGIILLKKLVLLIIAHGTISAIVERKLARIIIPKKLAKTRMII